MAPVMAATATPAAWSDVEVVLVMLLLLLLLGVDGLLKASVLVSRNNGDDVTALSNGLLLPVVIGVVVVVNREGANAVTPDKRRDSKTICSLILSWKLLKEEVMIQEIAMEAFQKILARPPPDEPCCTSRTKFGKFDFNDVCLGWWWRPID